MSESNGLAPVLASTPSADQPEVQSTPPGPLRVQSVSGDSAYFRLDIYDGPTLIGEYERSIDTEIDKKIIEVGLASKQLREVFQSHGAFQVRWNGFIRSKDIRVGGKTVATIPRECWGKPGR